MKGTLAICAVITAILSGASAYGQSFNPVIGGQPVFCNDLNNAPVVIQEVPGLPDTAISDFDGPIPRIKLNGALMGRADSRAQLFFFAHECAHHRLGHVIQALYGHSNRSRELEADCMAIRMLKQQLDISRKDAEFIGQQFRANPPMPPFYPAGPWREKNILACYGDDGDASPTTRTAAIQECMDRRPAACLETCETRFNLSSSQCAVACRPNDPKNRRTWLAECAKNPDW